MVILGREMSKAFEEYYQASLAKIKVEPEWISTLELPYGKLEWRSSDSRLIPQILINPNLPPKVFEHSAAHDLGHLVQLYEGYPRLQWLHIATNMTLSQALGIVGEVVTDLITDPDTERRLKPYGLWVPDRYNVGFDNLRTQLPVATPDLDRPARPIYVINAVLYAYAKTMLTESQWQTLSKLFGQNMPCTANLGNRIFKRLCDGAYDTAGKARQAYEGIFQELGLEQYYRFLPMELR